MLLAAHTRVACGALCIALVDMRTYILFATNFLEGRRQRHHIKGCLAARLAFLWALRGCFRGGFNQLDISDTATKGLGGAFASHSLGCESQAGPVRLRTAASLSPIGREVKKITPKDRAGGLQAGQAASS